jgi:zinc transporter 1
MGLSKEKRISIMVGIDLTFFCLELGVGLAVGSLALMADAFHMVREVLEGKENAANNQRS